MISYGEQFVLEGVENELDKAILKHRPMNSFHEGYAVIKKELDELWNEIKKQKPDLDKLRTEALHVAAMGARFYLDLVLVEESYDPEKTGETR